MDKQPILSLCIPTNGAVEWILPVLESIYSQVYDYEKFEVVITDNGKDSQLPGYIAKMDYPNLRYRQTNDEGFMNLVTCLKDGRGLFCKMINHRSVMIPGSIAEMVNMVEKYKDTQPIIYCADGNAKVNSDCFECENLDSFICHLSYWCTWSAGIGFWQKDIPNIDKIELLAIMPNISMICDIRQESSYVIYNKKYQNMSDDTGKGGYDLFLTFGVTVLDFLSCQRMEGRISRETFVTVKKDLYGFLSDLYFNEVVMPTKHTFILQDIAASMDVYYGHYYYCKMVIAAWARKPWILMRSFISRLIKITR